MKGIDISNNNGYVNLASVKSSGIDLVYIKATEGTTFVDSYKDSFYRNAKSAGLYVGFYHFLVNTSSPETQAENFYNQIGNLDNNLVPMLDVERNFSGINNYIERFINKFSNMTQMEIGIYSYTSFIRSYISRSFMNYKLWEANYNNDPWNLPKNFFKTVAGHQYTEKGRVTGVNGYCDLNEFNNDIFISSNMPLKPISSTTTRENIYLTLQRELNKQSYKDKNGNELVLDGIPGPLTLSACPLVKYGAKGDITTWIQLRCGASPDGIFGYDTEKAVKWMQNKWKIGVDGIVGPATWAKLLGL